MDFADYTQLKAYADDLFSKVGKPRDQADPPFNLPPNATQEQINIAAVTRPRTPSPDPEALHVQQLVRDVYVDALFAEAQQPGRHGGLVRQAETSLRYAISQSLVFENPQAAAEQFISGMQQYIAQQAQKGAA